MSHETRTNGGKGNESRMDLLTPDMQPQRILQSEDIWDLAKTFSFSFRFGPRLALSAMLRLADDEKNFMTLVLRDKLSTAKLLIFKWNGSKGRRMFTNESEALTVKRKNGNLTT